MDAATNYQQHAVTSASPIGLVILLYQSTAALLRRAIAAMEAGEVEARTKLLNRVIQHLAELKAMLNFERGGQVAVQLSRFYAIADGMILEASLHRDAEPLRVLLQQILTVQEAWQQLDAQPTVAPSSFPPPAGAGEARTTWQA